MVCQICGQNRPLHPVTLFQNIGLVRARRERKIAASLCRTCIDAYFWEFNAVNSALGWWGLISFFATIIFISNNWLQFFRTRRLPTHHVAMGFPESQAGGAPPACPNCRTYQQQPAKRPKALYVAIAFGAFLWLGGVAMQITANEGLAADAAGKRIFGVFLLVVGTVGILSGLMALRSHFVRCVQCNYQWPIA